MSVKSDLDLMGQQPSTEEPWQAQTRRVLEMVLAERSRQRDLHQDAMRALPPGTGPGEWWLDGCGVNLDLRNAKEIQKLFRRQYERASLLSRLTRMHLVREEMAELFELPQDDPEFIKEALQVAALLVQWVEYLLEKK